jgi:hypothetical protein
VGECDPNYEPNGTECDDEEICTGDDICWFGTCAGEAIAQAPDVESVGSKRFQVTPLPPGSPGPVALLVTSPDWTCLSLYIDVDGTLTETPVFQLIDDWGTIFVEGEEIVPDSTYEVRAECGAFTSNPGSVTVNPWCDHDSDGLVTIGDVLLSVEAFTGNYAHTTLEVVDIWPCTPNRLMNIDDLLWTVNTFTGWTYADTGCSLPCDGGVAMPDVPGGGSTSPEQVTLSVVPSLDRVPAGGSVDVDVYVSTVSDLRAYQVALEVTGGRRGRFELTQIRIDTDRAEYAFGSSKIVEAIDLSEARVGVLPFNGTADVLKSAYLGTFTFRASEDAKGTFDVHVQLGQKSLLRRSGGQAVALDANDARIAVGVSTKPRAQLGGKDRS